MRIDFTPALKAAAQKELAKYRIGPVFTPPSLQGTVQRPGLIGGANWGGGAFDPSSGVLFVKTTNQANIARIGKPDTSAANPRASEVDAELTRVGDTNAEFMDGLPLLKPPVRPSRRDRSEPRRDQVARAVRRHAVASPASGAEGRRAAAALGVAGRPWHAGDRRAAS